ncbi:MAG: aminopeptidase P family N-terminal domain-containing protein, partial [Acetobacteraceae bacterium]|nr:aminopeptidase P family N-terminal domain-containing protein [Acetobacteraceae bacterium]
MTPFDGALLDRLMEEAGIDVLLACSKHNIQYLLGGYRFFFFEHMDAMGLSRYLPLLIYPKRAPDKASYIGAGLESHMREVWPFWVPELQTNCSGTQDAVEHAVRRIRRLGLEAGRIGIEAPFLPADAYESLRRALPNLEIRDAVVVLERLRARKTPEELDKLRLASERVVDSMLAVMASHGPGATKRELVEA